MPTARWYGPSRAAYDFTVYPIGTTQWNAVPGIYIFTKVVNGEWLPIYIGRCASFKERICSSHHKWLDVYLFGATHVHALVVHDEPTREWIEADLLGGFNTPCNEVLN